MVHSFLYWVSIGLSTLGGVGVIVISIIGWASKAGLQKMAENDRHRHTTEIEMVRNQYAIEMEQLRTELAKNNKLLDGALLTLSQTRNVVTERQLLAIEALWIAIQKLNHDISQIITIQNILLPEEFVSALNIKKMSDTINSIKEEPISRAMDEYLRNTELSQLYVSPELWNAYNNCIVVQTRVMYRFFRNREEGQIRKWDEDKPIQQIMSTLSLLEDKYVHETSLGELNRFLNVLRQRFLTKASATISGEEAAKYHVEQARQFADNIDAMRREILNK